MPRNTGQAAGTSLTLPQDILQDLLEQQGEQIQSQQRLPQVRIVRGTTRFEFKDTDQMVTSFTGVILNTHPANILWDKPYGDGPAAGEEKASPGCRSDDGKYGTPRIAFRHAALGDNVATGLERIECATCPYNGWGSRPLLGHPNPSGRGQKGKACTNQRIVYVMVGDGDRETPVALTLPPTSISALDEYMTGLLNQRMPVQAVLTTFTAAMSSRGGSPTTVAAFSNTRPLTLDEFNAVMEKRGRYLEQMSPRSLPPEAEVEIVASEATEAVHDEDTEELPF